MSTSAKQDLPLPPDQPASEPSDAAKPNEDLPPASESPEPVEEEEEGECGFCLFMKGGGCRDAFIGWEECIQEAENKNEDLLEKCAQVTAALKHCMDAHSDYYEPILRAEKLAEEQAIIELEREKLTEEQAIIELEKEKERQNNDNNSNNQHPNAPQEVEKVVEKVAIIEFEKEEKNLPPNKSQPTFPSS